MFYSTLCIADCSDECINNQGCKFCRNSKNYNKCNNSECSSFVCKNCATEFDKNNIEKCIVNCNNEDSDENSDEETDEDSDEETDVESISCLKRISLCRSNNVYPEDSIPIDRMNCERICDIINSNIVKILRSKTCDNMCFISCIILCPITVSLLLLVINTKDISIFKQFPKDFSIVFFFLLLWFMGAIIILVSFCFIQTLRGKMHC